MFNKVANKLIVFGIVIITIIGLSISVQASTLSDKYNKGVSVGFTSMGNVNKIKIQVTGDYIVKNTNLKLKSGINYDIQLVNNNYKILQDSKIIFKCINDIILDPVNNNSYIKFSKNGYMRMFNGSMIFKKKNNNYFIPINILKIEDYIKGVIPFEVGESFPIEALKAQAVAARTYAIANKGRYGKYGYDLTDDTYCQVYRGFVSNALNCNNAVNSTSGEIITYNDNPISALYSSSNGGYTERNDYVWNGNQLFYFVEEKDNFDNNYKWQEIKTQDEINSLLKRKCSNLGIKRFIKIDISNIKKFPSGRINELPIVYLDNYGKQVTKKLLKDEARTFFGLKSSLYDIKVEKTNVNGSNIYTFNGKGFGHGIGMSQWGAYYRAKSGQDYKTILRFYYKNTNIQNVCKDNTINEDDLNDSGERFVNFKERIGGVNRFETSKLIAEKVYNEKIDNIVITNGNAFADALSGASLAKKINSPIVLVNDTVEESKEAFDYINFHLNKYGKIYILGGKGVIGENFVYELEKQGFDKSNIIRLGGENRYETSYLIGEEINSIEGTPIVIASGENFPDSLSISPIAAEKGWPIFLVKRNEVSPDLKEYICKNKPSKVYVVGGECVVSDTIIQNVKNLLNYNDNKVTRLGGKDRYETSKIINTNFIQSSKDLIITSGINFPDALSGSVYAAANKAPIILANSGNVKDAEEYIKLIGKNQNQIDITVLGLEGAINDEVIGYLISVKK